MLFNSLILLFYLIIEAILLDFVNSDFDCYSCASPILQSEWQVTGLPITPTVLFDGDAGANPNKLKQFAFLDKCGEKGGSTNVLPLSSCSGGACIEMLLVTNGIYSIVRGCLNDFFPPDHAVPTGDMECIYSPTNQNTSVVASNKVEFVRQAVVGLSLCQAVQSTPCNTKLLVNDKFAKGQQDSNDGWKPECKKSSGMVECLKCMRTDMQGDCHRDVRTYCTGRWLEVRGCSPFNPLNTQSCLTIERHSELSQLGDSQIPEHLSIEQCFCQGQRCNSAISIKGKYIFTSIFALILMAIIF
ncbi:hypothetical protein Mgra_00005230 [Meloidogyne graminicola]|uniref:Protein quiver n=1 Tax=Meloidogyne graminicola TaxID=189291 RepID=A0A8S9ZQ76_9BILA|nr:hypothetical protein Mgra_00005230 [Meloidogyne graminicola]